METRWLVWSWPLVGGLIGWLTNVVAIRMIFRPRRPVRIPLTPFTVQGLLPKRHFDLARSVGEAVGTRLLSTDRLLEELDVTTLKAEVVAAADRHVRERLRAQIPRFLPAGIQTAIEGLVSDLVHREATQLVDRVADEAFERVRTRVNPARIVEERIQQLDLDELEQLVQELARRELRHIEWLGAFLGVIIGLVQTLLAVFVPGFPFS